MGFLILEKLLHFIYLEARGGECIFTINSALPLPAARDDGGNLVLCHSDLFKHKVRLSFHRQALHWPLQTDGSHPQ